MVFDGDRGIDHVGRDVAEGNDDAVIALVADVGKQVAAPVVDQHVLGQAGGCKANDGGEIPDRLRRDRRHRHQGQRQGGDHADHHVALQRGAATPVPLAQVVVRVPVRMAPSVAAPHGFTKPYAPAATSHPRIRKKTLQAPKLASQRAAARVRRRRLRRSIRWPCPTAERCAPAIAIAAFPALTCIALVSALPDCHAGLSVSRNKFSYSRALPLEAVIGRRRRGRR